jgi:hypothetical protein
MMAGRMLLYGVLGALLAAVAMYACQLFILSDAGADLRMVDLKTLLVDVMALHKYALFGAALCAAVAPLSLTWYTMFGRILGWLLLAVLLAIVVPLAVIVLQQGGLPPFREVFGIFTPANKYLLLAVLTAPLFAIGETISGIRRVTRDPLRTLDDGGDSEYKADELIKDARRQRAERNLAQRRAETGAVQRRR